MLNKSRKTDQEVIDLSKEYSKILQQERGGRYTQNQAIKIALKKVLMK